MKIVDEVTRDMGISKEVVLVTEQICRWGLFEFSVQRNRFKCVSVLDTRSVSGLDVRSGIRDVSRFRRDNEERSRRLTERKDGPFVSQEGRKPIEFRGRNL